MGTRHLIAVIKDGEHKIAQYGQWDGYPEGQGLDVLKFLSTPGNIERLKESLNKVRFLDNVKDKIFLDDYNKAAPKWNTDPDNRSIEQKIWFETYQSRDLGADILDNVARLPSEEILLSDSYSFAGDSWCEWAYVIDLDKNTFEVYEGYNKTPLEEGERFKDLPEDEGYHPVKHVVTFSLDNLPNGDDFLKCFIKEDKLKED